ncbi:deformed epidermal autoregulatory factor 1 homolog [Anneissia japonica]|uniref:deformed epidermal autoregulatory factor 1 homolog n=1 Tax=Anneissia japonica TaxID=1529436 RepID=UPI0014254C0E|nr:deformed epidermal autoregulatory factor 1 homolog [Anneissia japonica]
MEATEVSVPVNIEESESISEDLPSGQNAFTTTVVSEHDERVGAAEEVFAGTPTAILSTDSDASSTAQLIAVVTDGSFDASDLKTPATPCTPASPGLEKRTKYNWDDAYHLAVLPVRCRNQSAELHKAKLGSGSKGKCIKVKDAWYTPSEFEQLCGRGNSKDWKRSIRYGGRTIQCLIEDSVLHPHAASCTCATCCDDEAMTGPVRYFVPYKRKKRDELETPSTPTATKKPRPKLKDAAESMRSFSLESNNGLDTPLLTPVVHVYPPSPPKTLVVLQPDQHWIHLEEMANSLFHQAQQLKNMVGQMKTECMASKESSLAHAKLQFEAEKKEAILQVKIDSQMQLSRALMEARAEKDNAVSQALAQARADKIVAVAEAKSAQLIKTCVNCGREAMSECTGCHQVSYCSSFCQRKDWASHQQTCGRRSPLHSPLPLTEPPLGSCYVEVEEKED